MRPRGSAEGTSPKKKIATMLFERTALSRRRAKLDVEMLKTAAITSALFYSHENAPLFESPKTAPHPLRYRAGPGRRCCYPQKFSPLAQVSCACAQLI
jgi:hypothetical protein